MTIAERRRQQFFRSKLKEIEMRLIVEPPNLPSFNLPWDIYTQGQYMLTKEDVELLEAGETFWHGETALSLEEE